MDKQRKSCFSGYEREFLKELISQHSEIIECRKTDAVYNKKKNIVWKEICDKFNSSPQCQKVTVEQIKKLWQNMKTRARDAKSLEKQRSHTGGGPFICDMDADNESVLSIIPNILPTVKVTKDSDGAADLQGDDDSIFWLPKSARMTIPTDIFDPVTTTTKSSRLTIPTDLFDPVTTTTSTIISPSQTIATSCPTPTTTSTSSAAAPKPRIAINKNPTIDSLKLELVKEDMNQRKRKFEIEIDHLTKINNLKYEMLQQELEHKKTIYKLIEAEHQAKLDKTLQDNSNPQ